MVGHRLERRRLLPIRLVQEIVSRNTMTEPGSTHLVRRQAAMPHQLEEVRLLKGVIAHQEVVHITIITITVITLPEVTRTIQATRAGVQARRLREAVVAQEVHHRPHQAEGQTEGAEAVDNSI